MNKLLVGLVIVLAIIITGEIVYLFYPKAVAPVDTIVATPSPVPSLSIDAVVNKNVLNRISLTRKLGHVSTTINQKFSGSIYKLTKAKYKISNHLEEADVLLLTDRNVTDESKMNVFIITQGQKKLLEVSDSDGKTKERIDYSNLSIGDNVEIEVQLDMSKPLEQTIEAYRITRIKI